MAEIEELRSMVLAFRVSELQMLLGFAQRNRTGKKNELQARALELIRTQSFPVQNKVRELYQTITASVPPQSQANGGQAPQPAHQATTNPSKDLQAPTLSPNMPQPPMQQRSAMQYPPHQGYNTVNQDSRVTINQRPNVMYPPGGVYYQSKPQQSNYPIQPDVRFKRLPFFDVLADLLKPSSLIPTTSQRVQEGSFPFHLTPTQATEIASNRDIRGGSKAEYIQVQLRFCLMETTCEQEDVFPPNVIVKVNNKQCPLPNPIPTNRPNTEPKRPPRPVNITNLVKLSPIVSNIVTVSWASTNNVDYNRGYALCICLVKKLTFTELLQRLKVKGSKHSDYTRGLIKEKLNEDADCEIATTSLRVSLMCPLGKIRMTTPCRASTCSHLQCFDASLYLQMNEKKATWMCPVCDKPSLYDNLVIDGYFQEVLNSSKLPSGINEIQLHKDGSWSTQINDKKTECLDTPMKQNLRVEVISDDLEVITVDSNTKDVSSTATPVKTDGPKKKEVVVDLTLSESDEDDLPLKRKATPDSTHSVPKYETSRPGVIASSTVPGGPSSVSSSGYRSPSVITLDSPSPPRTSPALSMVEPNYQKNPLAAVHNLSPMTNTTPAHQSSVSRSALSAEHQKQLNEWGTLMHGYLDSGDE